MQGGEGGEGGGEGADGLDSALCIILFSWFRALFLPFVFLI